MVRSDWRRLRWIEDLSFCLGEGVMLFERGKESVEFREGVVTSVGDH